ncbi:MAG: M48 family metalloprotease [Micavibrio aeruginosavorus]|nr:M48 family metalloprotease [Micavibrio aeruginosavorus]
MRSFFKPLCAVLVPFLLAGCAVNPATGDRQFTALMSPGQESSIGAQEHGKILQQFGGLVEDPALQSYVGGIGSRLVANTERPDVVYQFFVLDSPVINAFALPGGYVYVTRGLLAVAGSEAELAAVLAHEIGHITARHAAERYSHGVVTSLGAAILAAALDSKSAAQALGVGSDLYVSSYSRKQESQSDELGIRYLHRAGYDPAAMASFLTALGRTTAFENQESGNGGGESFSYFSTHPQTATRAAEAQAIAASYPPLAAPAGGDYLRHIDGLIYGDSPDQGFVRGTAFWHPGMGFTFSVPDGYVMANSPAQVLAKDKASGTVILFDSVANKQNLNAMTTGSFSGTINRIPVTVRLVAVEWKPGVFFRFQMAIPARAAGTVSEGLKRATYSLREMTAAERQDIRPHRLRLVTAKAGDSVTSLSAGQPYPSLKEQRFRALNNMAASENVVAGKTYKTVAD